MPSQRKTTTARNRPVRPATHRKATKRRRRAGRRRLSTRLLLILIGIIGILYIAFLYKALVSPYSFRWKALYGEVTYPPGEVRGIDISHYQQKIDWNVLRNASIQGSPLRFVFIKATEGTDRFDPNFNSNFHAARRNGIVRGAYHFFSLGSSASKQAEFFCRMVQLEEGDLPPVLDVETEIEHIAGYDVNKLRSEVLTWLRIVERHYGVKPILYTGYKFRMRYLSDAAFDDYPFWIAHYYVDKLAYKGPWAFWQHTDAGRIDGIKGDVDINLFNGSLEDFNRLLITPEVADSIFQ